MDYPKSAAANAYWAQQVARILAMTADELREFNDRQAREDAEFERLGDKYAEQPLFDWPELP